MIDKLKNCSWTLDAGLSRIYERFTKNPCWHIRFVLADKSQYAVLRDELSSIMAAAKKQIPKKAFELLTDTTKNIMEGVNRKSFEDVSALARRLGMRVAVGEKPDEVYFFIVNLKMIVHTLIYLARHTRHMQRTNGMEDNTEILTRNNLRQFFGAAYINDGPLGRVQISKSLYNLGLGKAMIYRLKLVKKYLEVLGVNQSGIAKQVARSCTDFESVSFNVKSTRGEIRSKKYGSRYTDIVVDTVFPSNWPSLLRSRFWLVDGIPNLAIEELEEQSRSFVETIGGFRVTETTTSMRAKWIHRSTGYTCKTVSGFIAEIKRELVREENGKDVKRTIRVTCHSKASKRSAVIGAARKMQLEMDALVGSDPLASLEEANVTATLKAGQCNKEWRDVVVRIAHTRGIACAQGVKEFVETHFPGSREAKVRDLVSKFSDFNEWTTNFVARVCARAIRLSKKV